MTNYLFKHFLFCSLFYSINNIFVFLCKYVCRWHARFLAAHKNNFPAPVPRNPSSNKKGSEANPTTPFSEVSSIKKQFLEKEHPYSTGKGAKRGRAIKRGRMRIMGKL